MTEFECNEHEDLSLSVWPMGDGESLFNVVNTEGTNGTVVLNAAQTTELIKLLVDNLTDKHVFDIVSDSAG